MNEAGKSGGDQTLEINPTHPIILNLNLLRKDKPEVAEEIAKHMLDNVMLVSGIPYDMQGSSKNNFKILEDIVDANLDYLD